MEFTRKELMHGVELIYAKSDKFKTNLISLDFILPLTEKTTGADSLLPAVLRRGSEKYPDMKAIEESLAMLYGAGILAACKKRSEYLCVGLTGTCIDDRFAPGGEKLLEPLMEMMGELLFHPLLEKGCFREDYVTQERNNLLDDIYARINDKRLWADYRLIKELCAGEPYGVFREEENTVGITSEQLYARYEEILRTAPVKLIYCGSAEESRVEAAARKLLRELPREKLLTLPPILRHTPRKTVHTVTERMEVEQGKLAMGFAVASEDETAMRLADMIFGCSSNSKLFLHVREELSLCYYASTQYQHNKGLIMLSSGIAPKDYDRAFEEIMKQLTLLQQGSVEPWEYISAESILRNAFRTAEDSPGKLGNYLLSEAVYGTYRTLSERIRRMEEAKPEEIVAAASTVKLDTVYFLSNEEVSE